MVIQLLIFSLQRIFTLSTWRPFLAMFCAFGKAAACLLRERVCSACQSLHSSHLPYASWICAHLQLVVTGCYLAGRHSLRCQWKETGCELLKYKLPFFCTMRQPLKNLCRLQIGCLYQINYTTIVTFICYLLGMLSESTRSVFIVADDKRTL